MKSFGSCTLTLIVHADLRMIYRSTILYVRKYFVVLRVRNNLCGRLQWLQCRGVEVGKTWESCSLWFYFARSQARIKRALQGNFLFQGLSEKQRSTLIDYMDLMEVNAGDTIIRQVLIEPLQSLRATKLECSHLTDWVGQFYRASRVTCST